MKKLILKNDEPISGKLVPGQVELGRLDKDGRITATHPDVTRGNLEARLRLGTVIAIDADPIEEVPPVKPPAKSGPEFIDEQESEAVTETVAEPAPKKTKK